MISQPEFDSSRPLGRDDLARLAAADIPPGWYVNLGIGLPTESVTSWIGTVQ
jgi:acyl CoA:acetate/3-ketoacid CoA transferase beta subunit